MTEQRILAALLREDLSSFIHKTFHTVAPARCYLHNWHIDAIAWHLSLCARGEINRLIITVPPRYLKSICATIAFPAWVLGHDPTQRSITASYADALAVNHARLFRMVVVNPWYQRIFPRTRIDAKKNTETEVTFTRGGYRLATTVGGTLTGRGGDIVIVDDPIKAQDALSKPLRRRVVEWFDTTLLSRLDDKEKGVIIVIMRRLHPDDLGVELLDLRLMIPDGSLGAVRECRAKTVHCLTFPRAQLVRMHIVPGRDLMDRPVAPKRRQRNTGLEIRRKPAPLRHIVSLRYPVEYIA